MRCCPSFSREVVRLCLVALCFCREVVRLCLAALCFRREVVRLCLTALCFRREVVRLCLAALCFRREIVRPCLAALCFCREVVRLCLAALCFRREIVRPCLAALCFCREVLRVVVVIFCIVIVPVLHPLILHLSSSDLLQQSLFLSCLSFSFSCSSILFYSRLSFLQFDSLSLSTFFFPLFIACLDEVLELNHRRISCFNIQYPLTVVAIFLIDCLAVSTMISPESNLHLLHVHFSLFLRLSLTMRLSHWPDPSGRGPYLCRSQVMLMTTYKFLRWMHSTRWMNERVVQSVKCWMGIEEKMPDTCLNALEGKIRKSDQKFVMDDKSWKTWKSSQKRWMKNWFRTS